MRHWVKLAVEVQGQPAHELVDWLQQRSCSLSVAGVRHLIAVEQRREPPVITPEGVQCTLAVNYEGMVLAYAELAAGSVASLNLDPQRRYPARVLQRWEQAALKADWKTLPPDETQRQVLEYQRNLTPAEFRWVALGITPLVMEDKWFAYMEHSRLHYHRSWTGQCVFVVDFAPEGAGYRVAAADCFHQFPSPNDAVSTLHRLLAASCTEAQRVLAR